MTLCGLKRFVQFPDESAVYKTLNIAAAFLPDIISSHKYNIIPDRYIFLTIPVSCPDYSLYPVSCHGIAELFASGYAKPVVGRFIREKMYTDPVTADPPAFSVTAHEGIVILHNSCK